MATIKSYTDLPQSKVIAEFLPHESADMHYAKVIHGFDLSKDWKNEEQLGSPSNKAHIPCWSLAALLKELPDTILGKDKDGYVVMVETMGSGLTAFASNPVDACYEMILKLHELNLL